VGANAIAVTPGVIAAVHVDAAKPSTTTPT